MKNSLLKKRELIIYQISSQIYFLEINDKLPLIVDFEKRFDVSRGTIQNAINYLKENKYISLVSKGHMGTFVTFIDYQRIQKEILNFNMVAVLPFPYSNKKYLGIATALYNMFDNNKNELSILYNRGSSNRFKLLEEGTVNFVISSMLSAEVAINKNRDIKILKNLGENTYTSDHILIAKNEEVLKNKKKLKVGIDYDSYDQKEITLNYIKDKDVELVEISSQRFLTGLEKGEIDCAIWDLYSISSSINKYYHEDISNVNKVSNAVIVIRKDDVFTEEVLKKKIDVTRVREVIKEVVKDEIVPVY